MLNSFRYHHDGETLAASFALRDVFADVADRERNFRNENDVCPAANAGLERDPAAVASHDLDHHDAMMRSTGRVNLIDGVAHGVQRGVEAECNLCGRKIVVDGLGHTHNLHALLEELVANFLRSIAADGNGGIDAQFARVGHHLIRDVARNLLAVLDHLEMKRFAAVGGAEDRAAAGQDAADFLQREFERLLRPDESVEAVGNADHLPSILEDGGFGGGAYDGVEAGSVSASGGDSDAANFRHKFGQRMYSENACGLVC